MNRKPALIDWILCDDIRREDSGKLLFIGVYMDKIILKTLPVTLPQLVIFSKWNASAETIKNFTFSLFAPDGSRLANIKGKTAVPRNKQSREKVTQVIQLGITPFKIPATGKYRLQFTLNDTHEYDAGYFNVLLQDQEFATVQ